SHNPWQGYMQNCNVSPEHMMFASPMTPERYQDRPYLYNADNPLHQRAAMTRAQLHANTKLTVAEAMEIALSTQGYNAELWQKKRVAAGDKRGGKLPQASPADKMFDLIVRWNRRCDADSVGAIAYRYWFDELDGKVMAGDKAKLGKAMTAARAGLPPPRAITDQTLVHALTPGGAELLHD